jgi:hypothetical protein
MVESKKKCMWSNYPALKVGNILTMSINSIRRSMGLSKHQEHGMNALGVFLLKMILGSVRPTTLKVRNILTMSINSIRCSMGLSKHQEHSMNALGTFLLKMVLGLVRPTLLSSLEKQIKIYLYAKSMLMILYLVILINPFVMSLAK